MSKFVFLTNKGLGCTLKAVSAQSPRKFCTSWWRKTERKCSTISIVKLGFHDLRRKSTMRHEYWFVFSRKDRKIYKTLKLKPWIGDGKKPDLVARDALCNSSCVFRSVLAQRDGSTAGPDDRVNAPRHADGAIFLIRRSLTKRNFSEREPSSRNRPTASRGFENWVLFRSPRQCVRWLVLAVLCGKQSEGFVRTWSRPPISSDHHLGTCPQSSEVVARLWKTTPGGHISTSFRTFFAKSFSRTSQSSPQQICRKLLCRKFSNTFTNSEAKWAVTFFYFTSSPIGYF